MSSSAQKDRTERGRAAEASPDAETTAFDRRTVLVGAGIATLLGMAGIPTSDAAVASGTTFDLNAPAQNLFYKRRARDATVMQGHAFDDSKGVLYVAQLMESGRQLPGESAPVSGSQRAENGDICVSRLSYGGSLLSWMYLRGFGHPTAMGVESAGGYSYLWLGTASVPNGSGGGYGTRVGRVRFVPGGVVTYGSSAIEVHTPVSGARGVTVSFDRQNRTLLVRYHLSDNLPRYRQYRLDSFRARNYDYLHSRVETGISDTFQGHTHFYDQVYRLEGRAGGVTTAPTHLSRFNLSTGTMAQRVVTKAGSSLTFREPEGLSVRLGPPRLHMGFADGTIGARNFSLYYKSL